MTYTVLTATIVAVQLTLSREGAESRSPSSSTMRTHRAAGTWRSKQGPLSGDLRCPGGSVELA